ncbi:hypothetical protein EVAR_13305_1 [Eumeta japonica]|uniref:Uncharacterized protein n=1 Tax=Eumeta variegata TaxID=151549 RepID=A0A4C1TRQ2_EUMVA|nr:hypothetical protein EVAR_13305_1 [Eumeta japonica]
MRETVKKSWRYFTSFRRCGRVTSESDSDGSARVVGDATSAVANALPSTLLILVSHKFYRLVPHGSRPYHQPLTPYETRDLDGHVFETETETKAEKIIENKDRPRISTGKKVKRREPKKRRDRDLKRLSCHYIVDRQNNEVYKNASVATQSFHRKKLCDLMENQVRYFIRRRRCGGRDGRRGRVAGTSFSNWIGRTFDPSALGLREASEQRARRLNAKLAFVRIFSHPPNAKRDNIRGSETLTRKQLCELKAECLLLVRTLYKSRALTPPTVICRYRNGARSD